MEIDENEAKKAVIIVNPASGKGGENEAKKRVETIRAEAEKLGWKGRLIETTLKLTAQAIASKAIAEGTDHIVVCGGDGTIMEAVAAAVNKNVTLGIVPGGTGNLFAQNLDIPLDLKSALKTALLGKRTKIDAGKANDTYFTIMTGVGLDAAMLKEADREMKDKFGVLAYIVAVFKHAFKPRSLYELRIDNKEVLKVKAKSIMVANMAEITGGIEVVPNASPQSGKLKIGVLKTHSLISWLELLFKTITKNIKESDHYELLEGKHIEIRSLQGKSVYECDGTLFPPADKVEIDIYPASLSVMVPDKSTKKD